MRKFATAFIATLLLSQSAGHLLAQTVGVGGTTPAIPAMTQQEKEAKLLTPEVMLKMRRLGGAALSPDGKTMVYSVGVQNVEGNSTYSNIFAINVASKLEMPLTEGMGKNFSPTFSSDGKTIYYISTANNGAQLWSMDVVGSNPTQISDIEGGISGYKVSPKGDKVLYVRRVTVGEGTHDVYPKLDKTKARIYDDLMVRHWDAWNDNTYLHPFIADLNDGKLSNHRDIIPNEAWDVPTSPYFSMNEITWNNAGTVVAYTARKLTGTEFTLSTNTDIFLYDVATAKTRNITAPMPGYDKYPVFSPDDKKIAFSSMRRAVNEADKSRLMVWDSATGKCTDMTPNFDYNTSSYRWDGNDIYFLSPIKGAKQICKVTISGKRKGQVTVITKGDHSIGSLFVSNKKFFGDMTTISSASEIIEVNRKNGKISPLTSINSSIYDNVTMGEVQKRWIKTTDGKDMLTWVILPPNFDASKKYPTLLYCQGGPQSMVGNQWSYRWNFQLMAAQGYIVVAPNRRGLPGFGQEWLDQISGDYSGQNIKDYFSAIDEVAKEPWADETRLGCVGASYGGYSTFYIAGHHNKRFKALISHCGMFNFESFYLSTEELWFPTNDLGGSPYSDSEVAKRSYANSPHKFVKKWDTPILIFVGEQDYRIPYTQSLEAFTAARLMGIDARLVSFPDEAHQVFKPQNALLWHSEFYKWLDKYLK